MLHHLKEENVLAANAWEVYLSVRELDGHVIELSLEMSAAIIGSSSFFWTEDVLSMYFYVYYGYFQAKLGQLSSELQQQGNAIVVCFMWAAVTQSNMAY